MTLLLPPGLLPPPDVAEPPPGTALQRLVRQKLAQAGQGVGSGVALVPLGLSAFMARAASARAAGTDELAAITRRGIDAVVEHVVAHRDIYARGLPDTEDASLHRMLVEHFTVSSAQHIRELDGATRQMSPSFFMQKPIALRHS